MSAIHADKATDQGRPYSGTKSPDFVPVIRIISNDLLTAYQHAAIYLFMRKVTVRISDELFKKLGHYCVDADKSVNEVITDLLEKMLSEGKKTKR